jgi:hypothetical protein
MQAYGIPEILTFNARDFQSFHILIRQPTAS